MQYSDRAFRGEQKPVAVDIFEFWGKAQPRCETGPQWHPLVCHSLDVAAVAEAVLVQSASLATRLSHWFNQPQEQAVRLIAFLIALHDIGKFAKRFQAKKPERFPSCFQDDLQRLTTSYDHGAGGLRLFDAGAEVFGMSAAAESWRPLVSAVAGHHGKPPQPEFNEGLNSLRRDFGKAGIDAARTFVQEMRELMRVPTDVPPPHDRLARQSSFAVAGLAVLADWIGSNQDWFPYKERIPDAERYWREARKKAADAVSQAGVLPARANRHLGYDDLLGHDVTPTPMQRLVRELELPPKPALFLIEDETGSGKTEAALMLAHRLMVSKAADGLYVALPTMATANAMFDRLADSHRALFAKDSEPSIALAHGARDMHQGFRAAMLRGARREEPYSGWTPDGDQSAVTASAACAEWVADDRRRAFLADIGAGTLDQALMSVLPTKHQSLRLLGLMRQVLILDEVHAYDPYMQRELECLLEFQAGLGGSAILLSATLPRSTRMGLTTAFARGLKEEDAEKAPPSDYPLLTVRASHRQLSVAPPGESRGGRELPIRWSRSCSAALLEVEQAAAADKAVLYIRNTVEDAIEAYSELSRRNLDVGLFHARFALGDRLAIEKKVVETYGKGSATASRRGRVLIATQVVEQSLDLDFDALITDLAPIDLLIQRAGRLWRHRREDREGQLEMVVVGPEATAKADENWFAELFPRAAYVYRDHARLWLTARVLEETGRIESPCDLRRLMEAVYGEEADSKLPDALQGNYWEAEGSAGAERSIAGTNLLNFPKGYVRDGGSWGADVQTPTRLSDDTPVTLRLARTEANCIQPYALRDAPNEPWRAWRLSEVSVSGRRVGGEALPSARVQAANLAKAEWSSFEKDKILVVLHETTRNGQTLVGTVMSADDTPREVRLSYDALVGLKVG